MLLIQPRSPIYSLEVWSPKDIGDALIVTPPTRELSNEDMAKLSAILGGSDNVSFCEESEFCVQTLCPPSEMENWLKESWIEHDISEVLARSEMVAPNPTVLIKQYDGFFTARLFSSSDMLDTGCAVADREDAAAIFELNHLYSERGADDVKLP